MSVAVKGHGELPTPVAPRRSSILLSPLRVMAMPFFGAKSSAFRGMAAIDRSDHKIFNLSWEVLNAPDDRTRSCRCDDPLPRAARFRGRVQSHRERSANQTCRV